MPDVGSHRHDRRGCAGAGRGAGRAHAGAAAAGRDPRRAGRHELRRRPARRARLPARGRRPGRGRAGRRALPGAHFLGLLGLHHHAAGRRPAAPRGARAVARRAPGLQRPRDDAFGLPGRDVPGGGVRGVGRRLRRRSPGSCARGHVRHPRRRRRRARPGRDPRRRPRRAPVAPGRAARRTRGLRPSRPRRPRPAGHARAALAGRRRLQRRRPAHPAGRGGRGGRHRRAWRSPTCRRRHSRAAWRPSSSRCCRDRRRRAARPDLGPRERARGRGAGAGARAERGRARVGEPGEPHSGALRRGPARRARDARGGGRRRRGHATGRC